MFHIPYSRERGGLGLGHFLLIYEEVPLPIKKHGERGSPLPNPPTMHDSLAWLPIDQED
jgi:hypothetical protein